MTAHCGNSPSPVFASTGSISEQADLIPPLITGNILEFSYFTASPVQVWKGLQDRLDQPRSWSKDASRPRQVWSHPEPSPASQVQRPVSVPIIKLPKTKWFSWNLCVALILGPIRVSNVESLIPQPISSEFFIPVPVRTTSEGWELNRAVS